jgi:flagellar secretion chaperone FliS
MYGRSNAISSYGRVANAEVDPIQQLVMLYDGAIKFLRMASNSIESNDITAKAEQTDRALQIVSYLQSILDFEQGGEVSITLNTLYTSVTIMILKGSAKLDAKEMLRAAELLAPVRDAWAANARAAAATAGANMVDVGKLAPAQRQIAFTS